MASTQHDVFLTGGTGFMGSSLTRELLRRGHHVRALVRPGSESKLAPGCDALRGDALNAESYASQIAPADTFVHLVGVAHPSPRKAAEFRAIDLKSCQEAVGAAAERWRAPFCLSQCGAARAHHAGVPGGTRRR